MVKYGEMHKCHKEDYERIIERYVDITINYACFLVITESLNMVE